VRMDEPIPIWVRWWLIVVLPLGLTMGMILIVMFVPLIFQNGKVSPAALLIILPAWLLANTVLAVLRCFDWFEARKAKKAAEHG
jgi:hypothetical protein